MADKGTEQLVTIMPDSLRSVVSLHDDMYVWVLMHAPGDKDKLPVVWTLRTGAQALVALGVFLKEKYFHAYETRQFMTWMLMNENKKLCGMLCRREILTPGGIDHEPTSGLH